MRRNREGVGVGNWDLGNMRRGRRWGGVRKWYEISLGGRRRFYDKPEGQDQGDGEDQYQGEG